MPHPQPAAPSSTYLDRLMRRESFAALWPLFSNSQKPAKEMTESFSALEHLREDLAQNAGCRVIHVGDGAYALTAAMFALKSKSENISVDPQLNERIVSEWCREYGIRGVSWRKSRIQDVIGELNALPPRKVLVTFVHAHVGTDEVLDGLHWDVAYSLACCQPHRQLSKARTTAISGEDFSVLSPERRFQLIRSAESDPE